MVDYYGLDAYEFRIYARIVRRAERGDAWESIPRMAKACLMSESRARLALQLLEAAGLIASHSRSGYSTLRRLRPKQEWAHPETLCSIRSSLTRTKSDTPKKSDRGGTAQPPIKSDTGVVAEVIRLPLSKVTDEGIPVKVLPFLSSNPRNQKKEKESEKTEKHESGSTPESLAFVFNQPELTGKEPTNLGQDKCDAAGGTEKIENSCAEQCCLSEPPASTSIFRSSTRERLNRTAEKLDWEIQPGVPYPAFVKWRSQHYIKQGGHWADAAIANAKSEIRNNPQRAADLWSQFLEYSNTAADNALAHQAAGITPTLPSCFADSKAATASQVMGKFEALGGVAMVALPQAVATASFTATTPYMAAASLAPGVGTAVMISAGSVPGGIETPGAGTDGEHATDTVPNQTIASACVAARAAVAVTIPEKGAIAASPVLTVTMPEKDAIASGVITAGDSIPDYQKQEQNMRRVAQMVQQCIKPMPKRQLRQKQPSNHFEKMRFWLQGDEPALRSEALAWLYRCQDVQPIFDEYGNPYDFTEIEF